MNTSILNQSPTHTHTHTVRLLQTSEGSKWSQLITKAHGFSIFRYESEFNHIQ